MFLREADKKDLPFIKELYFNAFPKNERKPFGLIKSLTRRGIMRLLVVDDGGMFGGFAVLVENDGITLIDYLAIKPQYRGKGWGSKVLELLKEEYPVMVLEIESPEVECDNKEQRLARKNFYIRSGFVDYGVRIKVYGVVMEMLCYGDEVSFESYSDVFKKGCGFGISLVLKYFIKKL